MDFRILMPRIPGIMFIDKGHVNCFNAVSFLEVSHKLTPPTRRSLEKLISWYMGVTSYREEPAFVFLLFSFRVSRRYCGFGAMKGNQEKPLPGEPKPGSFQEIKEYMVEYKKTLLCEHEVASVILT